MCTGSSIFWGTLVDKMTKREKQVQVGRKKSLVEERKEDSPSLLDICRCTLEALPVIHSGRRRQT